MVTGGYSRCGMAILEEEVTKGYAHTKRWYQIGAVFFICVNYVALSYTA